jgi:hypothetical protein
MLTRVKRVEVGISEENPHSGTLVADVYCRGTGSHNHKLDLVERTESKAIKLSCLCGWRAKSLNIRTPTVTRGNLCLRLGAVPHRLVGRLVGSEKIAKFMPDGARVLRSLL